MDLAQTLIRTVARTFYDTRQILLVDALLTHSVLDANDLGILLSAHPKDVRKYIAPLRAARLVSIQARVETRVGSSSNRGVSHDYYYVHFHNAIDAIKYRIMRLKRQVEQMYKQDVSKKAWRCPHCKAEYDELEVLDNIGEEGFLCHRCSHVLEPTEDAGQPTGNHERIRTLNTQLAAFENLILKIDAQTIPENNFAEAWARKKDVPRTTNSGQVARQFMAVGNRRDELIRGPEQVNATALNINITSGEEHDKEEEAKKEARRAELAKQNQLPVWHTNSAIRSVNTDVTISTGVVNGDVKKEEDHDKTQDISGDAAIQEYLEEMKREQEEEERKKALEDMENADDEDDFEDVIASSAGTPISSQQPPTKVEDEPKVNGLKRELDSDSAPSSDANTPKSEYELEPVGKRVKFEGGGLPNGLKPLDGGSDDDEADFEDAI